MTQMLANLKIGRKLAVVLSTGIVPAVCLGALGLWALRAVRGAVGQEQLEPDKMMSAQRVASGLGRVNSVVGHITLSDHCENCHSDSSGGTRDNETAIAKECVSLLEDLKNRERVAEGRKLVDQLVEASTGWLNTNLHALELNSAGKKVQAAAIYKDESIPGIGPVDHALGTT